MPDKHLDSGALAKSFYKNKPHLQVIGGDTGSRAEGLLPFLPTLDMFMFGLSRPQFELTMSRLLIIIIIHHYSFSTYGTSAGVVTSDASFMRPQ